MSRAALNLAGIPRTEWWASEFFRREVEYDAGFTHQEQLDRHKTALNLALSGTREDAFACEQMARCFGFIQRKIKVKEDEAASNIFIAKLLVISEWRPSLEADISRLLLAYADAGLMNVDTPVESPRKAPLEVAVRANRLVQVKALLDAGADTSQVPFGAYVAGQRLSKQGPADPAKPTPVSFDSPALALVRAAEMERRIKAGAADEASVTVTAARRCRGV